MELRTKWAAIALIVLLLGSLGAVGVALTQSNSTTPATGTTAPLNSAYVQYQQNKSAGKVVMQTPDGRGLSYEPPPIEFSKPVAPAVVQVMQVQIFPTTYDLLRSAR